MVQKRCFCTNHTLFDNREMFKIIKRTVIDKILKRDYIILAIWTIGFLLLASRFTSPLFPNYYGADASEYMVRGQKILAGYTLYVDSYEYKGPVLYYIQVLAQMLFYGRTGIFLLQCIFHYAIFLFIYKTARLIIHRKQAYILLCLITLFFAITLEKGNLTEEYSLPFILFVVYTSIKYMLASGNREFPWQLGLIYGICLGIVFLIRITNVTTIAAFVCYLFFYLLSKKQYKALRMNLLFGMLGFSIVAILSMLYLIDRHAVREMINVVFVDAFSYAQNGTHRKAEKILDLLCKMSPLFLSLPLGLIYITKSKEKYNFKNIGGVNILSSAILALTLFLGNAYLHYFMLLIPNITINLCLLIHLICHKRIAREMHYCKFALLMALVISIHSYFPHAVNERKSLFVDLFDKSYLSTYEHFLEQGNLIPPEERDNVWGYRVHPRWFAINNILPCYKYEYNQTIPIANNPSIGDEIHEWLNNTTTLWIVASPIEKVNDNVLKQKLSSEYELISQTPEGICLYHLINES